jgi:hypothetical protein
MFMACRLFTAVWLGPTRQQSEPFVEATKEKLRFKGKGRKVVGEIGTYQLRESPASYNGIIGHENAV